jgi:hypothetical protein
MAITVGVSGIWPQGMLQNLLDPIAPHKLYLPLEQFWD